MKNVAYPDIITFFELKKAKGPKLGYFYSVKQKLEYVVKKFILKFEKDKKEIQKTNNIKNLYAFRNKYNQRIILGVILFVVFSS